MGAFMTSVYAQAQQARHPTVTAPSDAAASLLGQTAQIAQIAEDIAAIRRALGAAASTATTSSPTHIPSTGAERPDILTELPSVGLETPEPELD
jgi:hypothetical protein